MYTYNTESSVNKLKYISIYRELLVFQQLTYSWPI
uniref:Uncharacterized protein n=1 Tax=Anguilla anguilla TaxID=7936 RepID=A0A0E9QRV3_ANGAN